MTATMIASSASDSASFLPVIAASLNAVSLTTWLLALCVFILLLVFLTLGVHTASSSPASTSADSGEPGIAAERLPGPSGFAAARLLLGMRKGAPRKMFNKTRTYGKIFGVGEGEGTLCILTDYDSVEEAFQTKADSFSERGGILQTLMSSIQERGSISNNGAAWHESKAFVAETIKNSKYGRTNIDRCIEASFPNLRSALEENNGEPFDPRPTFESFFIDVLHRIMFGEGVDYDDDEVRKFIAALSDVVGQTLNPSLAVLAIPSLSVGCLFSDYRSKLKSSARYVEARSKEALIKRDAAETATSLVTLFARYIERIRAAGKSTLSEPEDGWRLMYDFFFAAFGTVHESILWTILILATREDMQERMRAEISSETKSGGDVSYDERTRLPIVMAVMVEIMRMRPVAPMGVPHFASEGRSVSGYSIPKGAQLMPNLWGMHNDPDVWEEPSEFNPDRFLTTDGQFDWDKANRVIPFSMGPRSCPGEQVARRTIFKTLVTLVSSYRISFPPVGPRPCLVDEENSFTMVPDPFKLVLSKIDVGSERNTIASEKCLDTAALEITVN